MNPTTAPVATALITDPLALFSFLLAMVAGVFWISEWKPLRRFFEFLPPLIFCYFLPMITTSLGITPAESSLYGWFNKIFLPPLLLLLLISADVKAIARLGIKAVGVMLSGTLGIVVGAFIGYLLFSAKLDQAHGAQNIGALSASWVGGSANMYAVQSALAIPQDAFAPMIIVDTVMAYSWLGILIALAGWQVKFAHWFKVDARLMDDVRARMDTSAESSMHCPTTREILMILALGLVGGYLAVLGGGVLHAAIQPWMTAHARVNEVLGQTLSKFTLTIILVTAGGLALSFTPVRRLEKAGASRFGYAMLFLLLPTFGAQADLRQVGAVPWYAAVGAVMLLTQAVFILVAMRLLRAPLFFGAVGSMANIGGPASASVVAGAYEPEMAPVGVLLGVMGGIMGTFIGLMTAALLAFL